jgi:DNA topoisomerase I
VQSVAVRLLVQRERERRAFRSGTYWDLKAHCWQAAGGAFRRSSSRWRQAVATGKDFDENTGRIIEGRDVVLLDEERGARCASG